MVRSILAILLLFISILFSVGNIYGGDKRAYEGQSITSQAVLDIISNTRSAEYKNLKDCLEAIKKNTGSTLDIITDQPSQISGFLSNGEHFGCVEKVTDEKGTYVDGWYTVK